MKPMHLLACVVFMVGVTSGLTSCNNQVPPPVTIIDTVVIRDTVYIDKQPGNVYQNQRFRDVTVERVGNFKFVVKGKAQVFEATFSWVIEDGHNELKKGFDMTDEGAPALGNFAFVVDAVKQRPNSTLHLVLFEVSAKDGSRQHQLPIPLY